MVYSHLQHCSGGGDQESTQIYQPYNLPMSNLNLFMYRETLLSRKDPVTLLFEGGPDPPEARGLAVVGGLGGGGLAPLVELRFACGVAGAELVLGGMGGGEGLG